MASSLALGGCTSMSSTVDGKTHVFTEQQSCPTLLEMDRGQTLEVLLYGLWLSNRNFLKLKKCFSQLNNKMLRIRHQY